MTHNTRRIVAALNKGTPVTLSNITARSLVKELKSFWRSKGHNPGDLRRGFATLRDGRSLVFARGVNAVTLFVTPSMKGGAA